MLFVNWTSGILRTCKAERQHCLDRWRGVRRERALAILLPRQLCDRMAALWRLMWATAKQKEAPPWPQQQREQANALPPEIMTTTPSAAAATMMTTTARATRTRSAGAGSRVPFRHVLFSRSQTDLGGALFNAGSHTDIEDSRFEFAHAHLGESVINHRGRLLIRGPTRAKATLRPAPQ